MCQCLGVSRSTYYYQPVGRISRPKIDKRIVDIFHTSHHIYGARKIKAVLWKTAGMRVSRRYIRKVMKARDLVSVYTQAAYHPPRSSVNNSAAPNAIAQCFQGHAPYAVITSDLTYVKVRQTWHYVCIFLDLFNREIIGYSAGCHKTSQLVYDAVQTIRTDLRQIQWIHSDRGSEFNAEQLRAVWQAFGIQQSLSRKGCPYDNAVSESTFHILKTEFIRGRSFNSLEQLRQELAVYVYWYNHIRIHGSLDYQTPIAVRESPL